VVLTTPHLVSLLADRFQRRPGVPAARGLRSQSGQRENLTLQVVRESRPDFGQMLQRSIIRSLAHAGMRAGGVVDPHVSRSFGGGN